MRTNTATRPEGGPSHHGMPIESTPLLNGGGAPNHDDHFWRDVFLNSKTTPGMDSHNPFVSWPVHGFNVLKITLFSSTLLHIGLSLVCHKAVPIRPQYT